METLNVGILIFDDVEVLDFAGPFEVFSRTRLIPGVEARRSEGLRRRRGRRSERGTSEV